MESVLRRTGNPSSLVVLDAVGRRVTNPPQAASLHYMADLIVALVIFSSGRETL